MTSQRCKVVVVGRQSCGKSSLVNKYVIDQFNIRQEPTIGGTFIAKEMMIGNETIRMEIWDTAGCERFRATSRLYYRNAFAAIICCDQLSEFSDCRYWSDELKKYETECHLYLALTKTDTLTGEQEMEQINKLHQFAAKIGAVEVFSTSSKNGKNVREIFQTIARKRLDPATHTRSVADPSEVTSQSVDLRAEPKTGSFCCPI